MIHPDLHLLFAAVLFAIACVRLVWRMVDRRRERVWYQPTGEALFGESLAREIGKVVSRKAG